MCSTCLNDCLVMCVMFCCVLYIMIVLLCFYVMFCNVSCCVLLCVVYVLMTGSILHVSTLRCAAPCTDHHTFLVNFDILFLLQLMF